MTDSGTTFDVVVIGGGPAGYGAALYGASCGLSVALIEKDKVGGTCLHRGCVPAKEFLETAAVWRTVGSAASFGVNTSDPSLDFSVSQERKNTVVESLFKGLSGLLDKKDVTVFSGTGCLRANRTVEIMEGLDEGTRIQGTAVILASGSIPRELPNFEVDGRVVLSSDEFLNLDRIPQTVAVVGGGAIGCEFASMLSDLGAQVTIIEGLASILSGCDEDVSTAVERSFKRRSIEILTSALVTGHELSEDGNSTTLMIKDRESLEVQMVVISIGRQPLTDGLIGEDASVFVDDRGFIVTDDYLRTSVEGIYAVGDVVANTPQLAHVGFAEAISVIKEILGEEPMPIDYSRVPWAIYCHPEVAFAGLTETQAREAGLDIVVKKDPFNGNSRARIIGETEGMVKVIAESNDDGTAGRILGVHMVGPWVTEQIGAGYLAVNWEATAGEIAEFLQPHPSLSETFGETVLALTGRGLHLG